MDEMAKKGVMVGRFSFGLTRSRSLGLYGPLSRSSVFGLRSVLGFSLVLPQGWMDAFQYVVEGDSVVLSASRQFFVRWQGQKSDRASVCRSSSLRRLNTLAALKTMTGHSYVFLLQRSQR
jgi:hypothetical protein